MAVLYVSIWLCACVWVLMEAGSWLGILLSHLPSYFWKQRLSLDLELTSFTRLPGQWAPEFSPQSPPPLLGLRIHIAPCFYTGSGEPILGPHAGMAGNLPAEPSPQGLFWWSLVCFKIHDVRRCFQCPPGRHGIDPGQLKTLVWLLKNYVRAPHQDGLMILWEDRKKIRPITEWYSNIEF